LTEAARLAGTPVVATLAFKHARANVVVSELAASDVRSGQHAKHETERSWQLETDRSTSRQHNKGREQVNKTMALSAEQQLELQTQLQRAVVECSERCLYFAAKWYAKAHAH
jgi:hypothetical protein